MFVNFNKNNFLMSLAVILAGASFSNVSSTPKTWSKDASGRALVYRAEPSKWAAVGWCMLSSLGVPFAAVALDPTNDLGVKFCSVLMGMVFASPGIYGFKQWYHNYDSLYKPLIIMDKYGIAYEGKDKISWKKFCGCENIRHTVYIDGCRYEENYLEISTDVDKFKIYENAIAITLPMLLKLINESYKAYQEFEKEKLAA